MEIIDRKIQIENDILAAMKKPNLSYWVALAVCAGMAFVGHMLWGYQVMTGMGVSGKNNPVGWYIYITDFVFWVGIAHSGTLISAILYLFRAGFRNRFNRSAEAMTLFAIMVAGLFPLIHLGRVWFFYWIMPYPNQRQLWVNFKSPLIWDVVAVNTYFAVSAMFFYVGLIPDLAIVRKRATGLKKMIYGVLSLGWTGSLREWVHYDKVYLFLAAFATPLVVSVHSVVSWDFAMSIVPGWHTTIFAPYFVAGAIFSGTAMVIVLVVPMRQMLNLENHIRIEHIECVAKILLFMSLIVTYSYIVEAGLAFYGNNVVERETFRYRAFGDFGPFFWTMIFCNSILPLTLFIGKLRRSLPYLFAVCLLVNVGMWLERLVIIVTSLARDYEPYSWGTPNLSFIAVGITLGSFGTFFLLFLVFVKVLPVLSMTELKEASE